MMENIYFPPPIPFAPTSPSLLSPTFLTHLSSCICLYHSSFPLSFLSLQHVKNSSPTIILPFLYPLCAIISLLLRHVQMTNLPIALLWSTGFCKSLTRNGYYVYVHYKMYFFLQICLIFFLFKLLWFQTDFYCDSHAYQLL